MADNVRLEPEEAQRLRIRGAESWRITKHDFPSNRLCLQAFSPYNTAEWTKQWRESKGVDLKKQISKIVEELIDATPVIVRLVEEGERQAAIERQKWEEDLKRWEREEAERRAAEAMKTSKAQLLQFITSWTEAKRINDFFAKAAADLMSADDETRRQLEPRLELAKQIVGDIDALKDLRRWKTPQELLEYNGKRAFD